ncbi:MAG: exosome complex protein Rrp42 [Candidatus Thermoplasmatota archaeon]|jgi:exosome complex component RRP42|nr:exosome complex protein Rrp42 [Candidatus Thermoplasmatota archaeon]
MTVIASLKRDYLSRLAEQGKRADGRRFDEYRKIEIETGVVSRAEGSAKVKIGNTQVIVGIKMDIGEPYPDSPNCGVMTTAAELIPMASPDFEAGPPQEDAIELARVVDRGIRESEIIEFEKLCIEPADKENKGKVWIVFIDIHILDYDGNLFDTASLAALAALFTANVPAKRFELGEDYPLPLRDPPISCTAVKFNRAVVFDPSLDEEEIAEARLTVATDKNGHIRAMQKGLNGSFTKEEIKKVIKASIDNGKELRNILYKSIGK